MNARKLFSIILCLHSCRGALAKYNVDRGWILFCNLEYVFVPKTMDLNELIVLNGISDAWLMFILGVHWSGYFNRALDTSVRDPGSRGAYLQTRSFAADRETISSNIGRFGYKHYGLWVTTGLCIYICFTVYNHPLFQNQLQFNFWALFIAVP